MKCFSVILSFVFGVPIFFWALDCPALAANFTSGAGKALRFGTHEIVLTANGSAGNPFDTVAKVKFIPPSGPEHAVSVDAFFDGGDVWRARVYVSETGAWEWTSICATNAGLDGKSGG